MDALKYKHRIEEIYLTEEDYDKLSFEEQWDYECVDGDVWESPEFTEDQYKMIEDSTKENQDFWDKLERDNE